MNQWADPAAEGPASADQVSLPNVRWSGSLGPFPDGSGTGGVPGVDHAPDKRQVPQHNLLERLRAGLAGRYTVEREIGRGGMATVYLATDLKLDRQVALKVLHPSIATVVGPERFLREIDITAQLSHRHIVPLHDSGEVTGLPYYVMPYVPGRSLRDRLDRETQLSIDDALSITRDVAKALSYAHDRNLVHRDIKPANILFDEDGALVADFGFARAIDVVAGEELTSQDVIVGTPEYMSPEQGQVGGHVDARSDIYSLGCVLYEMLGGEPPFTGPNAQTIIARQMGEPPRSLTLVRPKIPPSVEFAIVNALEKVPADRPQTVERFVEMLDEPVPARPTPVTTSPWAHGSMVAAGLLGVVVIGVIVAQAIGGPALDDNRVLVFPPVDHIGLGEGVGENVGVAIAAALDHTEPLRWDDGWRYLSETQKQDYRLTSIDDRKDIASTQGARYFVDGSIARRGDSAMVTLHLNDASDGSLVTRASATVPVDVWALVEAGYDAFLDILPELIDPERGIDREALDALYPNSLAAATNWIQGERAYRKTNWKAALEHFRLAVEDDSTLVFAAIKGAQAASWLKDAEGVGIEEAEGFLRLALAHEDLLPNKYVTFARGLSHYYEGQADSAIAHFRNLAANYPQWAEAWMALGEAHNHLLPTVAAPDSVAEVAFERSLATDPLFNPPAYHLGELVLARGDLVGGKELIKVLTETGGDSSLVIQLELMRDCIAQGPNHGPWEIAATSHPHEVYLAGRMFAAGAVNAGCATGAFAALLSTPDVARNLRWGALIGQQGLLIAADKVSEAETLVDSAVADGMIEANFLYLLAAEAGIGMEDRATDVFGAYFTGDLETMSYLRLWFNGLRQAQLRNVDTLEMIVTLFGDRADTAGNAVHRDQWHALSARLEVLRGNPSKALAHLDAMELYWRQEQSDLWRGFAHERLLKARLQFETGAHTTALLTAAEFDAWPTPLGLLYLRKSIELRLQAAEALSDEALTNKLRKRLMTEESNQG